MSMTYSQFEAVLLVAIVEAADENQRGQVDIMAEATMLMPDVSEQWIYSAVKSFEDEGLVYNVSRSISPTGIRVMVTGQARKRAEVIRAQIAQAQQPPRKIGF